METIEDLQLKGLKFIQSDSLFRFGTDAVLLASFCDVGARDTVVDLGTGTGIIPVLLYGKTQARVTGIELQREAYLLAEKNIALNGAEDRLNVINGDMKDARRLVEGRVSAVVCNPPYDRPGSGGAIKSAAERIARTEEAATLEDAVASAASLLQTGGRLFMIHRAGRMGELMYTMKKYGFEAKVVRLVAARRKAKPGYVLVKAIKDAAPGMDVLPTLVIADEGGIYTRELKRIYGMEE